MIFNFRNWVLQTFPFLEDDFDALTDYELFCKMMEYVKKFAKDNEDFSKRLTDLENYINNLDFQDEVNKKLDEMAQDGTLSDIINQELFTDLNNRISTVEEQLSELQMNVPTEMIVFGDSWSDSAVPEAVWPSYVADNLNLNLHNYASNGAGYILPSTNLIETQVTNAINDNSYSHSLVKYIVFEGGINDYKRNVTLVDIRSKIISLINVCKIAFPGAKILYVNNFEYPYTEAQSNYWYMLQYTLSTSGINVLNQDGFYKKDFFLDNLYHLTVSGQKIYGSNVISALSGGQIKNDGVFIDLQNNKGYMYIRRDDNVLNYYILMKNLVESDINLPPVQQLCWDTVFDRQYEGSVNGGYVNAIVDFDVNNQVLKLARADTTRNEICMNGSIPLNIRL